jgi:hypothetical protein
MKMAVLSERGDIPRKTPLFSVSLSSSVATYILGQFTPKEREKTMSA